MKGVTHLIYWSVAITTFGCSVWPFFGGLTTYHMFNSWHMLLLTVALFKTTKGTYLPNRAALTILLLTLVDVLKMTNWTLGLDYFWDMTKYHVYEYLLAFCIIALCLIKYQYVTRPLFIPILLYILNFNNPCRRETN